MNNIGDEGVKNMAAAISKLPQLSQLELYYW